MVHLLSKLFNIRPPEWPRLLLLYLLLFVINAGFIWGEAIVVASFLEQVGVEDLLQILPWILVAIGVVSIPAMAIYTAFADRVANDRLLIAILLIGAVGIVIGYGLLDWGLPGLAYPLLYLLTFVPLSDIYSLQWATYVNSLYDTRAAKRVTPVLISSARLAGIMAGLTMPLLNLTFASSQIILIWLGSLIVATLIIWFMPYLLKAGKIASKQPSYTTATGAVRLSYLDNLREGYRYVSQSSFLGWLALSTLLLTVLLALLNVQTSQILLAELKTATAISNFTTRLTGVANLIILPILLFGLSRLISRIGLGNANLIYPTSTLAICGGLIIAPNRFTAALAYLDQNALMLAFRNPTDSLLYNAVPLRVKGRARAFIGGFIVPLGSLLGGGLLLLLPLIQAAWVLPGLIGLAAIGYGLSTLVIRKQYSLALIKMLEQEDFSFLLSQNASDLSVADPATLEQLQKRLNESTSYEFTIFMAKLISQMGGNEAVAILGQAARTATEARSRAAIIDVLVAADMRGEVVRHLYTDFLTDPDGRVRLSAVTGLEQLTGPHDKQFLALALTMLADPESEVRARVLPLLLQSNDAAQQAAATQALNEFLNHADPQQRVRGVHVLNRMHEVNLLPRLVTYLADPADEVRLEAAKAVEALAQEKLTIPMTELVLDKMQPLRQDPVERVRQAALTVLGRMGTHEAHEVLLNALVDPSSSIRATAADGLVQLGKAVIPSIHPALNSSDPQLRKMTTVVLSRINQREFGSLVEAHIMSNLLAIYRDYGRLVALVPCAGYPSVSVLQSALRERNQQFVEEIFYLLTAIHEVGAVKIVAESLRSPDHLLRANAVEALEALTTPQTAGLIAPLCEPDMTPTQLLPISKETWDMQHPGTVKAVEQFLTDPADPWWRAIMTLALGEMGTSLSAATAIASGQSRSSLTVEVSGAGNQPDNELTDRAGGDSLIGLNKGEERSARRKRPVNLFDVLTGLDSDAPAEAGDGHKPPNQRQPEEPGTRRPRPADLLGTLMDASKNMSPPPDKQTETSPRLPPSDQLPFTLPEIEAMVEISFADPMVDVRLAARAAKRMITGRYITAVVKEEDILLSAVEKIIFLKEVPFFEGMTVDQLKVLANVCEEQFFEEDTRIFNEGDPGGTLYVVVNGQVGIEQEKRKGSFARLATMEAHSYFGEANLFDNSSHTVSAIALQDTLALRLRREPLIALARQHPDLSLELINVLSQRLREANDRVAELTRTRTRELQKFFDNFD